MIEHVEKFDFGGFKYELHTGCFWEFAYYIPDEGPRQQLPVHGDFMTAGQAVAIHAMNSNGYCP